MSIVTVTATACPTGLTQISTYRDGVMHAARWEDIAWCLAYAAVARVAREACEGAMVAVITRTEITADSYSMTIEADHDGSEL